MRIYEKITLYLSRFNNELLLLLVSEKPSIIAKLALKTIEKTYALFC